MLRCVGPFLLFGLVMNVIMMLGFAMLAPVRSATLRASTAPERALALWDPGHPEDPSVPPLTEAFLLTYNAGVEQTFVFGDLGKTPTRMLGLVEVRAGWPMHAFEGSAWFAREGNTKDRWIRNGVLPIEGPRGVPKFLRRRMYVPMQPLLFGLLVNTLVYAWFGVMLAYVLRRWPRRIRRQWRAWRGRCRACAYPRTGSGVCPECGAPEPSARLPERA